VIDPIHPIRPTPANPPAVDPVRRVARTGDEPPQDEQPRRERPRGRPAPVAPQTAVADGHIDTLA